jgi:hypothetical protein
MGKEFNLRKNLKEASSRGDLIALKMLKEGRNPGKIFDGITQFNDVIKAIRVFKRFPYTDVKAVGMFGSRAKGIHTPLRSDIDLVVIDDHENTCRSETRPWGDDGPYREGICDEIHIEKCTTMVWNMAVKNKAKVVDTVRWLWVRKDTSLEIKDNSLKFNVKI